MNSPSPDLRSHFHLAQIPFTREIPVEKRFPHPVFEEATASLKATVENRMSAVLFAPAGSGKTMVLRTLVHGLPEARYRVHYLKLTSLSKRDFCRELAQVLGAQPAGHMGSVVRAIQDRMLQLADQESLRPVLLLDEAHELRPEVLSILRILTNFDMDSRLVLSLVLVGQPSLKKVLQRDELEAVARRISHYVSLRLFTREEIRRYLAHRLLVAGAPGDLFDPTAHDALFEIAGGNLRAIDSLALKALEEAAADKSPLVTTEHVVRARPKVCA